MNGLSLSAYLTWKHLCVTAPVLVVFGIAYVIFRGKLSKGASQDEAAIQAMIQHGEALSFLSDKAFQREYSSSKWLQFFAG